MKIDSAGKAYENITDSAGREGKVQVFSGDTDNAKVDSSGKAYVDLTDDTGRKGIAPVVSIMGGGSGGALEIKAGDNITITDNPDGSKTISADDPDLSGCQEKLTAGTGIKIEDKVISVDKKALNVVGKNLLLLSNKKVEGSTYPLTSYVLTEKLIANENYTIQIKAELGAGMTNLSIFNSGGNVHLVSLTSTDLVNGVYTKTFKGKEDVRNEFINIYIQPQPTTLTKIEWVKLEKGTIATEKLLAPEDYALKNDLPKYEEGTWTPSIEGQTTKGEATYTNRKGAYKRTGKTVTVQLFISGTFTTKPTGQCVIRGLPFLTGENYSSGSIELSYMSSSPSYLIDPSSGSIKIAYSSIGIDTESPMSAIFGTHINDSKFKAMATITYFTNN